MSAGQLHRLEEKIDERHGWALAQTHEDLREATSLLEDERYEHGLEKEGLLMRLRTQKQKEKLTRTEAVEERDKLELLVRAAEQSTKETGRQLRCELNGTNMAERRLTTLRESFENLKTELEVTCVALAAARDTIKEKDKELRRVRSQLEKEVATLRQALKGRCDEVELVTKKFEAWKEQDCKRQRRLKSACDDGRQERDNLLEVTAQPLSLS
jgi:hypothetical protein